MSTEHIRGEWKVIREGGIVYAQGYECSCGVVGCRSSAPSLAVADPQALRALQLRAEFERILSPAVDVRAPYAKAMIVMLIDAALALAVEPTTACPLCASLGSAHVPDDTMWKLCERHRPAVEPARHLSQEITSGLPPEPSDAPTRD
jgi:hypothetical protein